MSAVRNLCAVTGGTILNALMAWFGLSILRTDRVSMIALANSAGFLLKRHFLLFLLLSLIYRYFVQYFLIILLILRFGICFWSHAHFCRDLPEPHFWCSRTNAICPALWTPAPSPTRSHSLQSCRITAAWWPPARAPARTCCLHSTGSWAISPRASLLQTNTTRTTNKLSLVELHFFTT